MRRGDIGTPDRLPPRQRETRTKVQSREIPFSALFRTFSPENPMQDFLLPVYPRISVFFIFPEILTFQEEFLRPSFPSRRDRDPSIDPKGKGLNQIHSQRKETPNIGKIQTKRCICQSTTRIAQSAGFHPKPDHHAPTSIPHPSNAWNMHGKHE